MKDIEQQAIKILLEDTSRDVTIPQDKQLFNDLLNFGSVYIKVDKEGNQTRIHPMDIIITDK